MNNNFLTVKNYLVYDDADYELLSYIERSKKMEKIKIILKGIVTIGGWIVAAAQAIINAM